LHNETAIAMQLKAYKFCDPRRNYHYAIRIAGWLAGQHKCTAHGSILKLKKYEIKFA